MPYFKWKDFNKFEIRFREGWRAEELKIFSRNTQKLL